MNNLEKIHSKWMPIIDTIVENSDNETIKTNRVKNFLAEYSEHHSEIETPFMVNENMDSTLPASLKLLSMLNLEGVELNLIKLNSPEFKIVKDGPGLILENKDENFYENLEIKVLVSETQIKELSVFGVDVIQHIESLLIEENSISLNKVLETKKILNIYMMVNNINMKTIIEHTKTIKENLKKPVISISNLIQLK